jgi:spermidine synthase
MTDWLNVPETVSSGKRGLCEFVTPDFGHLYVPSRVLYKGKTAFQEMEILETGTFGRILFLDGKVQVSTLDEERYHQHLVQGPILCCENPDSVYIIGGGDGGAIEEAAKHRGIRRIVMAELDREVVERSKEFLPEISKGAFEDLRVELRCVDALADLKGSREAYDVIIVDLTEPHGPSKMLYTQEFYRLLMSRLTPGGAVGIHTDNYDLFPESYAVIYHTLRSVFGENMITAHVGMPCFAMNWSFRVASPRPIDPARLDRNYLAALEGGMRLDAFHPSTYAVQPTRKERDILRAVQRVSTDADPFDKFAASPAYVTGRSD